MAVLARILVGVVYYKGRQKVGGAVVVVAGGVVLQKISNSGKVPLNCNQPNPKESKS